MESWTIEEYITYMYQLVADADLETSVEEIQVVKKQAAYALKTYFQVDTYSYVNSLKKIQQTTGVNILDYKEVMKSCMARFTFTKAAKEAILSDLQEIANSDHTISPSESETIKFFSEMLQNVEMPLSW